MADISLDRLRDVLQDADWPLSKDDLVAHVEERTDDEAVRAAVRALPVEDYRSFQEIARSVDSVEAAGQSRSEKPAQARAHDHPGLAQHQRERRTG